MSACGYRTCEEREVEVVRLRARLDEVTRELKRAQKEAHDYANAMAHARSLCWSACKRAGVEWDQTSSKTMNESMDKVFAKIAEVKP